MSLSFCLLVCSVVVFFDFLCFFLSLHLLLNFISFSNLFSRPCFHGHISSFNFYIIFSQVSFFALKEDFVEFMFKINSPLKYSDHNRHINIMMLSRQDLIQMKSKFIRKQTYLVDLQNSYASIVLTFHCSGKICWNLSL
jgi:hypothetical protein